jgi:hypothetical protein
VRAADAIQFNGIDSEIGQHACRLLTVFGRLLVEWVRAPAVFLMLYSVH